MAVLALAAVAVAVRLDMTESLTGRCREQPWPRWWKNAAFQGLDVVSIETRCLMPEIRERASAAYIFERPATRSQS